MKDTKKGIFCILIATLGFSIIPIMARIGFSLNVSASTMLFYRFFLAGIFLSFYCLLKKQLLKLESYHLLFTVIVGGIIYSFQCLCFFSSFKYIAPSLGEVLYHCYPLFILILAGYFLKESITKEKATGVLLSIIGVGIVLYAPWTLAEFRGIVLVILTALISSIYMVYIKKYISDLDSLVLTTYLCFTCSFVFLAWSLLNREFTFLHNWKELSTASILAFFSTIVGFFAFNKSIKLLNVGIVSILSLAEPVFTIILSFLILGDRLTWVQLLGTLIILLAIYIYEKEPKD